MTSDNAALPLVSPEEELSPAEVVELLHHSVISPVLTRAKEYRAVVVEALYTAPCSLPLTLNLINDVLLLGNSRIAVALAERLPPGSFSQPPSDDQHYVQIFRSAVASILSTPHTQHATAAFMPVDTLPVVWSFPPLLHSLPSSVDSGIYLAPRFGTLPEGVHVPSQDDQGASPLSPLSPLSLVLHDSWVGMARVFNLVLSLRYAERGLQGVWSICQRESLRRTAQLEKRPRQVLVGQHMMLSFIQSVLFHIYSTVHCDAFLECQTAVHRSLADLDISGAAKAIEQLVCSALGNCWFTEGTRQALHVIAAILKDTLDFTRAAKSLLTLPSVDEIVAEEAIRHQGDPDPASHDTAVQKRIEDTSRSSEHDMAVISATLDRFTRRRDTLVAFFNSNQHLPAHRHLLGLLGAGHE
ncbi:hypothetical protein KIPB_002287 [Kipferlia bialata]|uniref:Gamma tubulin complex component C-terminal domain-containing protein n=1 Tax=Kipferlia bialata TaxID=797122 RepID=A0A9K3CSG6_9EUKA|nr:hypothetical protein KIPB_002287 [Kipferlia bialata]|eukprot:g2287.t1